MENLFEKIKEYVKMDEEISAEEFLDYSTSVIKKLTADFDQLTEDELFQAKAITSILAANAATRGKRRDANAKKFKKINEKSTFWSGAVEYRLKKSGLSEAEISERSAAIEKDMK